MLWYQSQNSFFSYYLDISISLISNFIDLTGVIHQLDVAMENVATQRGGLVFVYNMYGSKYANFDYDLSQKMLTLLKGNYDFHSSEMSMIISQIPST